MREIELSKSQACEHLQPVLGAGAYVKAYLAAAESNPTQAALVLRVNGSTMKRLCDGGALTVEMAAKLKQHYQLCSYDLFLLEASRKANEAQQLIDTGLM